MDIAEFKPVLTTLLMPPGGLLLLAGAGLLLVLARRAIGFFLLACALLALWLLSCHAVAVWLATALLPTYSPLSAPSLSAARVQAFVVLGGGIQVNAPEYGSAQANAATAARLRYGMRLSRATGLPLAFAGGVGWTNTGENSATEASTASTASALARESGMTLRWIDHRSRDTAENAARLKEILQPAGIVRVALVTHAWHMPRSQRLFERVGFTVTPAPMGFVLPVEKPLLEWLPSAHGLASSRQILREWLALRIAG